MICICTFSQMISGRSVERDMSIGLKYVLYLYSRVSCPQNNAYIDLPHKNFMISCVHIFCGRQFTLIILSSWNSGMNVRDTTSSAIAAEFSEETIKL